MLLPHMLHMRFRGILCSREVLWIKFLDGLQSTRLCGQMRPVMPVLFAGVSSVIGCKALSYECFVSAESVRFALSDTIRGNGVLTSPTPATGSSYCCWDRSRQSRCRARQLPPWQPTRTCRAVRLHIGRPISNALRLKARISLPSCDVLIQHPTS